MFGLKKIDFNSFVGIGLFCVVAFAVFFVDSATKRIAIEHVGFGKSLHILPFLDFTSVWNVGVSFGMMGSVGSYFLVAIASIIVMCLLWFAISSNNIYTGLCLAFVVGGALGNIRDRTLYGAVYDFIDFHMWQYHFPVFNFADMAITLGLFIYMILSEPIVSVLKIKLGVVCDEC